MKYITYLAFFILVSEFALLLVKRSKKSSSRERKDKGSLILLWIAAPAGITIAFNLADYHTWKTSQDIIAILGCFLYAVGLAIRWTSILQLKKAFTVDVSVKKDQQLKTDGMYRFIRHPSYLGVLLVVLGLAIAMNSVLSVLVMIFTVFPAVLYRIHIEEKLLLIFFGEDYRNYQQTTKRIIPGLY